MILYFKKIYNIKPDDRHSKCLTFSYLQQKLLAAFSRLLPVQGETVFIITFLMFLFLPVLLSRKIITHKQVLQWFLCFCGIDFPTFV